MNNSELNKFIQNIKLKKQYINKLKKEVYKLKEKRVNSFKEKYILLNKNCLIKYIIDITFTNSNTLIHVTDFAGNLKTFWSAGNLNYKGKSKRARKMILKKFYNKFILTLEFLINQPIALHLKNVDSTQFWIVKLFKKFFFIKIIKTFYTYPYNGCRKKKIRRKKMRTKKRKNS